MATAPTPPAKKGLSGCVVALIVALIAVPIAGFLAAIAIPAFVRYTRRAKAAEADTMLSLLARTEESYYAEHRVYVALPRRPAAPSCTPLQAAPPPDPTWDALMVELSPPIRGAYEVVVAPDGGRYTARGLMDLDCDGVPSVRERSSVNGATVESGDPE